MKLAWRKNTPLVKNILSYKERPALSVSDSKLRENSNLKAIIYLKINNKTLIEDTFFNTVTFVVKIAKTLIKWHGYYQK